MFKRCQWDNGRREYVNPLFQMLLAMCGTAPVFCPPYAPHRIAIMVQMILTRTENTKAMILDSQAILMFWGEPINGAVYFHHLMPYKERTKQISATDIKLLPNLNIAWCCHMAHLNISKGVYASVRLCNRIDVTCSLMVSHRVRVIVHVYGNGNILSNDHDPHKQSI